MQKPNFNQVVSASLLGGKYCPTCQYPLWVEPCQMCIQEKKKEKEISEGYVKAIGGKRAWEEYLASKFIRTQCNSKALDAALGFDPFKGSIMFCGPRGTGKSHLSAIIKRPLILRGIPVKTVCIADVMGEIKSQIKDARVLNDWVNKLSKAVIVSIEDMGVEKPSEFVVEFYYRIIDGRYRDKRCGMIITMNQEIEDLEHDWSRFDQHGRIVSRLKEMCAGRIYSLRGEKDWRAA